MGDRIDWEPKPYKKPAQGLAIDLWPTTFKVLLEEGHITWDQYAHAVPFDKRPMHLRHRPKPVSPHTPE